MSDAYWEAWRKRVREKPWRDLTTDERKQRWRAQYGDHSPEAHATHPRAAFPVSCYKCYEEREADIEAGIIIPISADE